MGTVFAQGTAIALRAAQKGTCSGSGLGASCSASRSSASTCSDDDGDYGPYSVARHFSLVTQQPMLYPMTWSTRFHHCAYSFHYRWTI